MDLFQYVIRENDTPESAIEKHRKLFDHAPYIEGVKDRSAKELLEYTENFEKYLGQSINEYASFQAYTERNKIALSLRKVFANAYIADTFLEPSIPELPKFPGERQSTLWRKSEIGDFDVLLDLINLFGQGQGSDINKTYRIDRHRLSYLKQLIGCIRSGGLHPLIWQRLSEHKRYNVILELNRRQGTKVEMMPLQTLARVQADFVQAFLQEKKFVVNGQIIPHKQVIKMLITATPLTNEEIPYFRKHREIQTDEEFIRACDVVTNDLVNNPFVDGNLDGSATVWSFLHPKIQGVALHHLKNGHYLDAVRCAVIELNNYLKEEYKLYSGREEDGTSLMQRAFSPGNPTFILADDVTSETGKNIQQGYMEIYVGVIRAMRNPVAHKNIQVSETECLEQLILFSHLMHTYEKSSKPTV